MEFSSFPVRNQRVNYTTLLWFGISNSSEFCIMTRVWLKTPTNPTPIKSNSHLRRYCAVVVHKIKL